MPGLHKSLLDSATHVAGFGDSAAHFAALDGTSLTAVTRAITELRRYVDQYAALAAGELAHRSRRELGHQGFAQKAGFVSPVAMIQSVTQVSKHEATRLVETGALLAESQFAASAQSLLASAGRQDASSTPVGIIEWRDRLARAISEEGLSLDAADGVRRVLSEVRGVDEETLLAAVDDLIAASRGLSPQQLYRRARQVRDQLDIEGIERREKQHRDLRSVRTWWDAAGMHCGSWRLAPEDGALVAEAFAQILSPRRGGPRFVDRTAKATAEELLNDPRSDDQVAADAFTDMIRLATDADPGTLFGVRRPAVRVLVTRDHLASHVDAARDGSASTTRSRHSDLHGHLEGQIDAVSAATIERHLCNTGAVSIGFDQDGQCVNVGRDARLFTARQRIGLAARDGGCLFTDCDRPPSYCEAHHINPWAAKKGRTDIADGILLCRRHHLLIHNNHWDVVRESASYFLRPPRDVDPEQVLIPMVSRSVTLRELVSQRTSA